MNAVSEHGGSHIQGTPLHLAACCGHADIVQLLLEAKADVNAVTAHGFKALHFAASRAMHNWCPYYWQLGPLSTQPTTQTAQPCIMQQRMHTQQWSSCCWLHMQT